LTGAFLIKGIQNNLHIIAVGIASDYYLVLDRRMREEINIQSFLHKGTLTPILREQHS